LLIPSLGHEFRTLRVAILSIRKKTAMNAVTAHPTHSEPTEPPASGSNGSGVGVGDGGSVGLGVFLVGGEGVSVGTTGVLVAVAVGVSVDDEGVAVAVGVGVTPRTTTPPSPNTGEDVGLSTTTLCSSAIAQVTLAMELDAPTTLTNKTTMHATIKLLFIFFHLTWAMDF